MEVWERVSMDQSLPNHYYSVYDKQLLKAGNLCYESGHWYRHSSGNYKPGAQLDSIVDTSLWRKTCVK